MNEKSEAPIKKQKVSMSFVLRFRLAVCITAALLAFVLKLYGGEPYERVKEAYLKYSRQSIVMQTDDDNSGFMRAVRK